MSGPAAPVHRCAFHAGAAEAAALALALARQALAAGWPVVAHVDDDVRRVLAGALPDPAVTFAPQRRVTEATPAELVEDWARHLGRAAGRVSVLCQQPFALLPDVARWRATEHATTAALAARPVELTCLVDTAAGPPANVAMASATHPVLWCDGTDLPNPGLEPAPRCRDAGIPLAERTLDPRAAARNRSWWSSVLADAGLGGSRRDELVLVLHEAVGTAAEVAGGAAGVGVRVTREGTAVTCVVAVPAPCPALAPSVVPDDRRLLLLWLAEKVSPAVSLTLLPAGDGCRIVVRAEDPDGG